MAGPMDDQSLAPAPHLDLGRAGEEAALALYRRMGYEVVARNWRCRLGELDLILRRGGLLVFCEVKSRRGSAFGGPFDAVTPTKQRKLRFLAEMFLLLVPGPDHVRFDVASVVLSNGGEPAVELFEDAF